ncbi:MAG: hypothetical protein CMC08_01200 [Flavobacteriaceae bacterium]|nr:hypothetical protein [Flavobacteriaceae bacterium]
MCTLTFIPHKIEGFIVTSNRDEAPGRDTLIPKIYGEAATRLLYPKDTLAGGTWIGASDKKRLVCLLNGGFTAHERKASYRMSRGIIVTDLLTASDATRAVGGYDLHGIEPFTLIMVDWQDSWRLFELVWDEARVHFNEMKWEPHIWSSSLLYSEEVKQHREAWFADFLKRHPNPLEADLLEFHKKAGTGDRENDIVMDRGFVRTKSITQVVARRDFTMRYEDLQKKSVSKKKLSLPEISS